jgi:hypothetical protein
LPEPRNPVRIVTGIRSSGGGGPLGAVHGSPASPLNARDAGAADAAAVGAEAGRRRRTVLPAQRRGIALLRRSVWTCSIGAVQPTAASRLSSQAAGSARGAASSSSSARRCLVLRLDRVTAPASSRDWSRAGREPISTRPGLGQLFARCLTERQYDGCSGNGCPRRPISRFKPEAARTPSGLEIGVSPTKRAAAVLPVARGRLASPAS